MIKFILFQFFFLLVTLNAFAFDRLDPHGRLDEKFTIEDVRQDKTKQKYCLGCHELSGQKLTLNSKAKSLCLNCHNTSPHSGISEHAKHEVTCVSCHTFHRALGKPWSGPSYGFRGLQGPIPEGLVEKTNPRPMLQKVCTDCHKW